MLKRKYWTRVIFEPAKSRIEKNQCPSCAKPRNQWVGRQQQWKTCSSKCSGKFYKSYIIYSWQELRLVAFRRDKYICKLCGKRPTEFVDLSSLHPKSKEEIIEYVRTWYGKKYIVEVRDNGAFIANDALLVGDHIVPIALGGLEFDLDNIQTLCIECNKKKTGKDAGEIAKVRKVMKALEKNRTLA